MQVVISSGHGKYIRGASGSPLPPYCDEVDEARKVTDRVADYLNELGVPTFVFHDDTSTTQSANLNAIVNYHNYQVRTHDVSIHFNAYEQCDKPMGCEVLYKTQDELAKTVADKICAMSGLKNRGAKYRDDLKFLNATEMPAILIEVAFCDSSVDCEIYRSKFDAICRAIAEGLTGKTLPVVVA